MDISDFKKSTCCNSETKKPTIHFKNRQSLRSIPSLVMGILIAFFPKCPICWATYMSMLGGIGLSPLPYMEWLYPVLLFFLLLHLFLLFRKSREKGYGPLVLSIGGVLVLLGSRTFFPFNNLPLFLGMLLIISGSLWNNYTLPSIKTSFQNKS